MPRGEACTPAAQRVTADSMRVAAGLDPAGADAGDVGVGVDLDAQMGESGFGFGGEVGRIGGQDARAGVEQEHAGFGGVDVAEVVAHEELGDVANGAGQLDAGGAAADDDEVERRMPAVFLHLALGQFKGKQNAAANFEGVLDGLEAGRERFPIVMAEIGVGGSGGEDEVVVR